MLKVIVIDDEPMIAQMIVHTINWKQLDMAMSGLASDGEEGEHLILQIEPDIVITDVRMPIIDGIELIKRIRNNTILKNQPHFIIISGYDDFQYAQSALRFGVTDYILKPYDEEYLTEILKKLGCKISLELHQQMDANHVRSMLNTSLEKLQKNLFTDFFRRSCSFSSLENFNRELSCSFSEQDFTVVILKVFQSTGLCTDQPLLDELQKQMVSLYPLGDQTGFFCFCMETQICMVINHRPSQKARVCQGIRTVFESLLGDERIKWQTSISMGYASCSAFSQLNDTYDHAATACDCFLLYSVNRCFCYDELTFSPQPDSVFLRGSQKTALMHAFECMDRERIGLYISEFFTLLDTSPPYAPDVWYSLCDEITRLFISYLAKADPFLGQKTDLSALRHCTKKCFSTQDFPLVLTKCMDTLLKEITAEKSQEPNGPIALSLDYIHRNYNQTLRLSDVASYVYLTPQYFSELFKKEVGQNFIDYLANYRIEIAKQYLITPGEKIKDIGAKVGYTDSKSFSQVFKKHVGLTPQEYRKLYL